MIIPMLCVTIFVILVVWFLLPRVARLMIHTPNAISIFVCLSMVQLMAVFISMQCTLCGHFLQVAFSLQAEDGIRNLTVTGVQTCALPIWTGPRPTRVAGQSRKRPARRRTGAVLGAALLALLATTPSFAAGPVAVTVLNPTDDTVVGGDRKSVV